MQKTKMIFTIGPSSEKESTLRELIKIGMNVARLNFSHGNQETHLKKIQLIKKLRDEMYTPTAIMIDIKGPKIRTHRFINDEIPLKQGQTFSFNCGKEIFGNNSECSISYATLYEDVRPGGLMLVDDGLIRFRINEIVGKKIVCTVLNDGVIKNYKGVNVPNIKLNLPSITEKDKSDLAFACKMDVDFVAASFIRKASDILEVRQILKEHGGNNIQVIAKIENQEGVDNIDSIIEVSDGIMIARGDMGVEIPIEHVPIIQKMIIKKCNKAGKIVITATQMLDSMIRNSIPTRAEASDICNAIFDGTDAIMLSGESASGLYPLEAASTMSTIAQEAEANIDYMYLNQQLKEPAMNDFAEAISYSACRTSNVLNANAIVAATTTGATAKLISKYKPKCPIIAITPFDYVQRRLSLNSGVIPLLCREFSTTDEIIKEAIKVAKKYSCAKEGDNIIVAAGLPTSITGGTNMMKIEKI